MGLEKKGRWFGGAAKSGAPGGKEQSPSVGEKKAKEWGGVTREKTKEANERGGSRGGRRE